MALEPILKEAKEKLIKIANSHSLGAEIPNVTVEILPVQQAIDEPNRRTFHPCKERKSRLRHGSKGVWLGVYQSASAG